MRKEFRHAHVHERRKEGERRGSREDKDEGV